MERDERIETLRRLAGELEGIEGAGDRDQGHLEDVRREVARLLADEKAEPDRSVLDRARALVHDLEDEHPQLAYAISQATEILGRMGI